MRPTAWEARGSAPQARGLERLPEAVAAAVAGRVARVLVASQPRIRKHVDPVRGTLAEPFGDEDALDELCALVLAKGGAALVSGGERVTESSALVAELRG